MIMSAATTSLKQWKQPGALVKIGQSSGSDSGGLPSILGRIGNLEVRLATNAAEVAAAQEIRFQVFYDELGASRQYVHRLECRDADRFDAICDHLIVVDRSVSGPIRNQMVGTYRLMRPETLGDSTGFYSDQEFALSALVARQPDRKFLELGRSCVLPAYRSKRIVELLWQGIWAYCLHYDVDVMSGCASFAGIIPAAHAEALSLLAHDFRADGKWDIKALPDRYFPMDLMPREAINQRRALAQMPPLLKGYLRLGAKIGDGCVIDPDFRTTDVFVVLPVENISRRYINHYGAGAERYAA